mmetsp:Transcript_21769/g.49547  ORF Transcript_21769/g.49547 Transcript_21769/m.49547 type:complete len:376 (-) Transcript_21769:29-1156(-)
MGAMLHGWKRGLAWKQVHALLVLSACLAVAEAAIDSHDIALQAGRQLEEPPLLGEATTPVPEEAETTPEVALSTPVASGDTGASSGAVGSVCSAIGDRAQCEASIDSVSSSMCLWDTATEICSSPAQPGAMASLSTSPTEECTVLTGVRGAVVQVLLFACCLAILFFKYLRDHGGRSFMEFAMDSSKQILGSGWVHVLNLTAAVQLEDTLQGDECSRYWLNIVLDCTVGLAVTYGLLRVLTALIQAAAPEHADDFRSGEYSVGSRKVSPAVYGKQLALWLTVLSLMKVCMVILMTLGATGFMALAEVFLAPLSSFPDLKLVFVMVMTPVFFNAFQFWVTDNFLRKKTANAPPSGMGHEIEREGSMQTTIRHDGGL